MIYGQQSLHLFSVVLFSFSFFLVFLFLLFSFCHLDGHGGLWVLDFCALRQRGYHRKGVAQKRVACAPMQRVRVLSFLFFLSFFLSFFFTHRSRSSPCSARPPPSLPNPGSPGNPWWASGTRPPPPYHVDDGTKQDEDKKQKLYVLGGFYIGFFVFFYLFYLCFAVMKFVMYINKKRKV